MTTTTAKINAALGITDPAAAAYAIVTKADLAAVAELILAAIPEKPAPQEVDDNTYHTIAATCRITCVTYDHAKAVLAHQRNIGRIRTTTTGARIEYHLGDFKRNLASTPYKPRRRRIAP